MLQLEKLEMSDADIMQQVVKNLQDEDSDDEAEEDPYRELHEYYLMIFGEMWWQR